MTWLPILIVPALVAAPPAPRKSGRQICESLMQLCPTKMDSSEHIEMRMLIKDGDWKELQSRLLEVNLGRRDFWMKAIHAGVEGAVDRFQEHEAAVMLLKEWKPTWSPSTTQKAQDEAQESAQTLGKQIYADWLREVQARM